MFRQRERFERTDVPRESPYRNVIGVVVCVVVLVATAAVVLAVWNRVSVETRLGDTDLSDAVDSQGSVAASADGYVASTDDRELTLLLTTDDVDAETGATLTSARILSVNHTRGAAGYIVLPVDAAVTYGDERVALSSLFSSAGYAACVQPLATATGIAFDHVVVSDDDVVEEVISLADADASELVSSASDFLKRIKTNMDAATLVSLAGSLASVGVENITSFDAPVVADTTTDEEGNVVETGLQAVDSVQLAITLGLLVPEG